MSMLYFWGANSTYTIPITGITSLPIPTAISGNTWVEYITGVNSGFAEKDGNIYAWGQGGYNGLSASAVLTPTLLFSGETFLTNTSNGKGGIVKHIIKSDGSLWGWGFNVYYGIGDGSDVDRVTPVEVGDDKTWKRVSNGSFCTIGQTTDNRIWSWGGNSNYCTLQGTEVGNTTTITEVTGLTTWVFFVTAYSVGAAIDTDGKLWTWGGNSNYATGQNTNVGSSTRPVWIATGHTFQDVSINSLGGAAITTDGKLFTWGRNIYYQTGQNIDTNSTQIPTQVGSDTDWMSVRMGEWFCIAQKTNKKLYSWGRSDFYQTGQNTTTNIQIPTKINDMLFSGFDADKRTAGAIDATLFTGIIAANQTICYNGNPAAFTSVEDAAAGISPYTYQWQYVTGSTGNTWNNISGATATTYDSANLTTTTWFRRRVIDSDTPATTGYSNTLIITVYPELYAGIIADNQTIDYGIAPALLTSTTNASGASGAYIYQWQYSVDGVTYSNIIDATDTTYQPPVLLETTYYKRSVYDTFCGVGGVIDSNVVLITIIPTTLPPHFCEGNHWVASGSSCGNNTGVITIIENELPYKSYFYFYDFTLTDVTGGTYTFNPTTGEATGLTSGYYFLTATVKPAYWYHYGRDACTFNWIKIEDTDTPLTLVGVSIKPLQCQPFDKQFGRIFYNVSGLTSGNTYSFYAFTSDLSLYYQETGITTTNDFILNNADAICYWVVIRDEVTGCALLIDNKCVPSVNPFSIGGIKKLWIASWSTDVDYNYWADSDDDYFLEFEDTSFFNSTKIKEYQSISGGTIQWYEIPVLPKVFKLSQKLGKVRQGFIFTDTLEIAIAKANASKWKEIADIINPENKWLVVLIDANDNAWTIGYRHGATVNAYGYKTGGRGEDNGYNLTIEAVSENKILTAIDKDYITNYIL